MKANKPILVLITILLFAVACKKDDAAPTPPPKTVLATANSATLGNYSYTYDAAGTMLTESATGGGTTLANTAFFKNYDTKGRLVEYAVVYNAYPDGNYTALISYNDDGKIGRKQTYDASGKNSGYSLYSYSSGNIIKKYYSAGNSIIHTDEYILSGDGANVIAYKSYNSAGALQYTITYSNFDSKKCPETLLPYGYYDYPASTNNYQAQDRIAAGSSDRTSFTVAFTYTDDGYPLKRTTSTGSVINYSYLKK